MLKNKKAFTLIELLIVIIIIGVLATITIVSYMGIVGQAKKTTVVQAIYNAAYGAVVCAADGVTPLLKPDFDKNVCTDPATVSAKYPAEKVQGYTITLPSSVAPNGVISGTFTAVGTGLPTITCINTTGTISCN